MPERKRRPGRPPGPETKGRQVLIPVDLDKKLQEEMTRTGKGRSEIIAAALRKTLLAS